MKITHTGGATNSGSGGAGNTGGTPGNGGSSSDDSRGASGNKPTGGASNTGGTKSSTQASGGRTATGGTKATGGTISTGGTKATGGVVSTGGVTSIGGVTSTGGVTSVGGITSIGGTNAAGGTTNTGGNTSTGGTTSTGSSNATGGITSTATSPGTTRPATCVGLAPPTASGNLAVANNYVIDGNLQGYAHAYVGSMSNSTTCVTPKCGSTGCTPTFGGAALCGAGVVTTDTTYNSIVGIGFNINQANPNGAVGTVAAPSSTTVTATMGSGAGDAAARLQIVDSASNSYCVDAGEWSSGTAIPISNFNTRCWNSPPDGMALTAGTDITAIDIVIPSTPAEDRWFSICLTGVLFS